MHDKHAPHSTVLLLEDEVLIAVDLQADLEEAGYSVAGPFVTCASALAWLSEHRPDYAILDTVLKDGPCKEVALTLASRGVPFLIYSGHLEDYNVIAELEGATWIEKPASANALLNALTDLTAETPVST